MTAPKTICLAGGKHRWQYREHPTGRLRECQKCGRLEVRGETTGRYKQIGSTRWKPGGDW